MICPSPISLPDNRRTPESSAYIPRSVLAVDPGRSVLAVDPGDKHVGAATWHAATLTTASKEYDADVWLPLFAKIVKRVDLVIIEKFVLYPNKASAQSWSPMLTSEMIGAMKWIALQANTSIIMQGADIKIPTRRQCKARGISIKTKSIHASDALLHLHYFLLRNDLED